MKDTQQLLWSPTTYMYFLFFLSVQDAYQLLGPSKWLWTLNSLDAYQLWATAPGLWTLNSLDANQIWGLDANSVDDNSKANRKATNDERRLLITRAKRAFSGRLLILGHGAGALDA